MICVVEANGLDGLLAESKKKLEETLATPVRVLELAVEGYEVKRAFLLPGQDLTLVYLAMSEENELVAVGRGRYAHEGEFAGRGEMGWYVVGEVPG